MIALLEFGPKVQFYKRKICGLNHTVLYEFHFISLNWSKKLRLFIRHTVGSEILYFKRVHESIRECYTLRLSGCAPDIHVPVVEKETGSPNRTTD